MATNTLADLYEIRRSDCVKKKVQHPDEFQWIAFQKDKLVTFLNGELKAQRQMRKNERIRVLAYFRSSYFDIITAMDWKTTLLPVEFVFVVAPKPVIESFPEPFPGVLHNSESWRGPQWAPPKYYNGIPVVGGPGSINVPPKEKRKPMVRLSLNAGPDKRLFYEVASFAVE